MESVRLRSKVNIQTITRLDRYRGRQNVAKQNKNRTKQAWHGNTDIQQRQGLADVLVTLSY